MIDGTGKGHLTYQDLRLCPSCSDADAPQGSLDFTLTSVTNGVGTGSVTASSDAVTWAVSAPVTVTLAAGSPGQLLQVEIAGTRLVSFCNSTSIGQCGA